MEQMDFSGEQPGEVQVSSLNGHDYVLREAKGDAVIKFQEAENGSWETITDEETGKRVRRRIKPAYKIESLMVSLCLFDTEGRPVPQQVVESFKPSVQQRLYVKAMEMTYPEDDLAKLIVRRNALQARIDRLGEQAKNGQPSAT